MQIKIPVGFIVFLGLLAFAAIYVGNGAAFADPDLVRRFALFHVESPWKSLLAVLATLPCAQIVVPTKIAAVAASSMYGSFAGILLGFSGALGACVTCFWTSRLLVRPFAQDILLQSKNGAEPGKLSWMKDIPVEGWIFLELALLFLPLPLYVAGTVLGCTKLRLKPFCIAAVCPLSLKVLVPATALITPGSFGRFFCYCLFLILALALFLWLRALLKDYRHKASTAPSDARQIHRSPSTPSEGQMLVQMGALEAEAGDEDPAEAGDEDPFEGFSYPGSGAKGSLVPPETARGSLLVCLKSPAGGDAPDFEGRLLEAAGTLGMKSVSCRLVPSEEELPDPVVGGFEGIEQVADIDEIVLRAAQDGAGVILAVRAASAFLGAKELASALLAVRNHGAAVIPASDGALLLGLKTQVVCNGRKTVYTKGLFGQIGLVGSPEEKLSAYCPNYVKLSPLPLADELAKPYVSVVVPAQKSCQPSDIVEIAASMSGPWSECVFADDGSMGPDAGKMAAEAGARVARCQGTLGEILNLAAKDATGTVLLFLHPKARLPQNFERCVWEVLSKEDCRSGSFSPARGAGMLSRLLLFAGAMFKSGSMAGPTLFQGVFLGKDDFFDVSGFGEDDGEDMVYELLDKVAPLGSFVVHNARMLAGESVGAKPSFFSKLYARSFGRIFSLFGKAPEQVAGIEGLRKRAKAMVAHCDHCGECAKACAMLARNKIDLRFLVERPLLAWNCFLCGHCARVCKERIDGAELARLLREIYIEEHGGRMSRPGHAFSVLASRWAPLLSKNAKPGVNLLLDSEFCSILPATAFKIARLCTQKGVGVVIADVGNRLSSLGMEAEARRQLSRFLEATGKAGVETLLTVSPETHAYLKGKCGMELFPVYSYLQQLGVAGTIDAEGMASFIPCSDRSDGIFEASCRPWLSGDVEQLDSVLCCGAGGGASVGEPDLAAQMKAEIASRSERVMTTCAICASTLAEAGCKCVHTLSLILGVEETPASKMGKAAGAVKFLARYGALSEKRKQRAARKKAEKLRLEEERRLSISKKRLESEAERAREEAERTQLEAEQKERLAMEEQAKKEQDAAKQDSPEGPKTPKNAE